MEEDDPTPQALPRWVELEYKVGYDLANFELGVLITILPRYLNFARPPIEPDLDKQHLHPDNLPCVFAQPPPCAYGDGTPRRQFGYHDVLCCCSTCAR
jgi:hypothetical protein